MTYRLFNISSQLDDTGQPSFLDGGYSWLRLAVSVLIATIGSVGMWSIIIILPILQTEFGASRAEASLPFAAIMIGFGMGNLLVGRVVDRFGIFWPMACSAILLAAGFYLSTQVTSIWQFAAIQGLFIGLGTGTCFGPLMSDISHWFSKRLGIAIAATASGNYFAGMLWPLALKGIIETEGWRSAYMVILVVILAIMLPLSLLLRTRRPTSDISATNTAKPVSAAPRQTTSLSFRSLQNLKIAAGVCCCVAMSMPQVHIVAYATDLGYGIGRGAEMLSLMLTGGIISRLASGVLSDYIGGVRTLLIGSALQATALFLYIPFDSLSALYIISFLFGLSQGGIVPSYAVIVREYFPAGEAGKRVGIIILATVSGMAFGGWLNGAIYDLTGSYDAAFINGIIWNMANLLIIGFILSRSKRSTGGSMAALA